MPDISKFITSSDVEQIISNGKYVSEDYVINKINDIKIPDVSKFITSDNLNEYAKTSDLPTFKFEEDGILSITIGNITHRYLPITTT